MTGDRFEAKLGEHTAHIENIQKEQDRHRTLLEDLTKSHRTLLAQGEASEEKLDHCINRLDAMGARHGDSDSFVIRLVRNNLDRISLWLVLILIAIQVVGKEKALELFTEGLLG